MSSNNVNNLPPNWSLVKLGYVYEITMYCKIVTSLSKTTETQKEIDELYDGVEE